MGESEGERDRKRARNAINLLEEKLETTGILEI